MEPLGGTKSAQRFFLHFGLLDPQNSLVEDGHENIKVAWGTDKVEGGQKLVPRFLV